MGDLSEKWDLYLKYYSKNNSIKHSKINKKKSFFFGHPLGYNAVSAISLGYGGG